MEKEFIIRGKRIFCRIYGSGSPVVLVHGFGEDSRVWEKQAEHLQRNHLVICPDLPGSGNSEKSDDMSMEGLAEVLEEIINAVVPNELVILIGHSMGGYVTLAFVEKYRGRLNAFGFFHSTAYADSEEKKNSRKKGIEFINNHGAFEFLRTTTPNLFSTKTRDENPQIIVQQVSLLNNFSAGSLVSYYQSMMNRPDRTHVLRESPVPVLFIAGEDDNALPLRDVLEQCHLPKISYIDVLQGSGHMGMQEEPSRSNEILSQFLEEIKNIDRSDR